MGLRATLGIELETFWIVVCSVANKNSSEWDGNGYAKSQSGKKEDELQGVGHGGYT